MFSGKPRIVSRLGCHLFALKNSATYPFWSMIDEFELVRPGTDEPHGVGSQRKFRTGRLVMHEEVVELVPDRLTAYALLSGFPMNEYRA